MSEDRNEGPSFDPKTWLKLDPASPSPGSDPSPAKTGPTPPDAPTAAPDPSGGPTMDPRQWSKAPGEPPAPPPPARPRSRPWPLIAGAVVALVAVGGALALTLGRPPSGGPSARSAAAIPAVVVRRAFSITSAADLRSGLVAAGLPDAEARRIVADAGDRLSGSRLQIVLNLSRRGDDATLSGLEVRKDDGSGLRFAPADKGVTATVLPALTTLTTTVVRGEMNDESFYSSAVAQGLTDSLISPFAQAFAFDFDFQFEIAPGDDFEAVIEQKEDMAGRPVGAPRLIYAAMKTTTKSLELYRFGAGDDEGWYDGAGRSTVKALMRTPVDGARISSQFGPRIHPIKRYLKNHNGTDFAAPTGTPIFAAGDGTIEFAAKKGANGNFVRILHDNGWRTLYLHLNAFGDGIVPGTRVRQGREIGQVGTTGRSTGPHLHYEVHTEAGPVDPLSIKTDTGRALSGETLEAFTTERDRIDQARVSGLD